MKTLDQIAKPIDHFWVDRSRGDRWIRSADGVVDGEAIWYIQSLDAYTIAAPLAGGGTPITVDWVWPNLQDLEQWLAHRRSA